MGIVLVGVLTAVVLAACGATYVAPDGGSPTGIASAPAPPPARESTVPGGFPTPSDTGVDPTTVLTPHAGDIILNQPGQVLSNVLVDGDVRVRANNVTIRNSEVLGRITNDDGDGHWRFTVEDTTVGPANRCGTYTAGAVGTDNYTARGVQIRGFSDGFRLSGNDVLITDSFVKICYLAGAHADGIQGYGAGTNIRLDHNTIDARAQDASNTAIFFADGSLGAEVSNNLLIGGGWTLRLLDESASKTPQDKANYTVTGNRVAAGSFGYGPAAVTDCDDRHPIQWSDNMTVSVAPDYSVTDQGRPITC